MIEITRIPDPYAQILESPLVKHLAG